LQVQRPHYTSEPHIRSFISAPLNWKKKKKNKNKKRKKKRRRKKKKNKNNLFSTHTDDQSSVDP